MFTSRVLIKLTAAFAISQAAMADTNLPSIETPGYAEKIDDQIANSCPSARLNPNNIPEAIDCIGATWKTARDLTKHVTEYVQSSTAKEIDFEKRMLATLSLKACEDAIVVLSKKEQKLNKTANPSTENLRDYLENSMNAAFLCMALSHNVEKEIGKAIEPKAKEHFFNFMMCLVNPSECKRPPEIKL